MNLWEWLGDLYFIRDHWHVIEALNVPNRDCFVTGDQVSRRGALTGGYYGNRRSRLELQDSIWKLQEKVEGEETQRDKLKRELESIHLYWLTHSLSLSVKVYLSKKPFTLFIQCMCHVLMIDSLLELHLNSLNRFPELDSEVTVVLGELQKVETQQVQLRWVLFCCTSWWVGDGHDISCWISRRNGSRVGWWGQSGLRTLSHSLSKSIQPLPQTVGDLTFLNSIVHIYLIIVELLCILWCYI